MEGALADRPILFSGPMVRALLDGRKTQTRRVLNPQPTADMGLVGIYAPKLTAVFGYETPDADHKVALRYMPGDRLYVREAWRCNGWASDLATIFYRASEGDGYTAMCEQYPVAGKSPMRVTGTWRPGIHMPRWASRLTLTVSDVRVQRLQEISEADALAEGCYRQDAANPCAKPGIKGFYHTWQELNSDRGYGWYENPWVVAITFTVERRNIDREASDVS
jgi:hypothetical protein